MSCSVSRRVTKVLVSCGTLSAITLPVIWFCAYQWKYHVERMSYLPPVINLVLYVLLILEFLVMTLSNPGVLKKKHFPAQTYNHMTGTYRRVAPQRFLEIQINGQIITTKYCVTCHIYRPPRTVHCSSCGGCVLRYDHHCPYIGNCIGFNNYRRFYCFVMTCCLYFLAMLISSVYRFVGFFPRPWESFEKEAAVSIWTFVSIIWNVLVFWLVLGLCCFHILIILKGQSTYDRIKGNYMGFNPFYRGCKRSLVDMLFVRHRLMEFVNPWSPKHSAQYMFSPGAMFTSQEQCEEMRQQNEEFEDSATVPMLNTHEKNTLQYIKVFGNAEFTFLNQSSIDYDIVSDASVRTPTEV
ncbi:DHHC zinc finger domain containing protein, putative [Babesia bigemina]|uniref:Palmitoyltransferase n=1 Tax=Babesia bigemina TaxID=5866 RepID=A0A061D937_BABBI|nr:DHHC zinc finger domain containing protein, putative [Babesia bigemina]CDR96492.1 DHHC zinc finger domain containing protein, putative [Babesia bigemina]|eukprot:XP_012768678.1 DHHC zinc finger domain containing protein, putative [Babesia bigemina]